MASFARVSFVVDMAVIMALGIIPARVFLMVGIAGFTPRHKPDLPRVTNI